jgi:hypothetical protein
LKGIACEVGPFSVTETSLPESSFYVNPEASVLQDEALLLAGFPNHVWGAAPGSSSHRSNDMLGVVTRRDGRSREIPIPWDSGLATPLAAPLQDGRFLVVWPEPSGDSRFERAETIRSAIWSGESWSGPVTVPVPEGHSVRTQRLRWGALALLKVQ